MTTTRLLLLAQNNQLVFVKLSIDPLTNLKIRNSVNLKSWKHPFKKDRFLNIVCPRCHSAGGSLHPTRSSTGKWIYYLRHCDPYNRERRRCLIGSDLSRVQISDLHYEEYLGILQQCVDEHYSANVVKGPAARAMMVKAGKKLQESGWDNTLFIEDKVKNDIIHHMATSHKA